MGVSRIRESFRSFFIKQMKSLLPSHPQHWDTPPPPDTHTPQMIGEVILRGWVCILISGWFHYWAHVSDSLNQRPNSVITSHCLFLLMGFLACVPREDHGNQEHGSYQIEATLYSPPLQIPSTNTDWGPVTCGVLCKSLPAPPPLTQTADSVPCLCRCIPSLRPRVYPPWVQNLYFSPLPKLTASFLKDSVLFISSRTPLCALSLLSIKINTFHPITTTPFPKPLPFVRLLSLLLEMCSFPQYVTFGRLS